MENVCIIYMFIGDYFIFDETFQTKELLSTVVILIVVIVIALVKLKAKQVNERKNN